MSDHAEQYENGKLSTSSGNRPKTFTSPAPDPEVIQEGPRKGQHKDYWVLSEAERAKGFVRPVRQSYIHVGRPGPKYPLRALTDEEQERYKGFNYVKYEEYPRSEESSLVGRFWTQAEIDRIGKGCGTVTTMSRAIAETYARDPRFYGATFCCGCGVHLRVGADGEFVWDGTNERVGT